jgi:NAD(P)-dependent dehydrogenase (short-subunit alcohol dehydrogenase family)
MSAKSNEVVVVTGASGGVGRAAAKAFGASGASVALLARGKAGLAGAKEEVEDCGGRALPIPTDVADHEAVEAAAEQVEQEFGPIDIWVNDAMATVFSPFLEISPDEFERSTQVSYIGFVNGTRAALGRMAKRNRGTIVQVGSALAYRGIPLQTPYCGAKHAIQGFTEALRCELYHDKVNVHLCMVQMPALNTPQFSWGRTHLPRHPQPVPPIFEPEVAAKAIVYAAHHRRREIYVGGPTAITIIGNKIAPGLGDHYLGRTGYSSQQTDQHVNGDRPDNLFEPADDEHDFGTRGIFDAHSRSWQLDADLHRGTLSAGVALLAAGASYLRRR